MAEVRGLSRENMRVFLRIFDWVEGQCWKFIFKFYDKLFKYWRTHLLFYFEATKLEKSGTLRIRVSFLILLYFFHPPSMSSIFWDWVPANLINDLEFFQPSNKNLKCKNQFCIVVLKEGFVHFWKINCSWNRKYFPPYLLPWKHS